jgi:hypothetical protein
VKSVSSVILKILLILSKKVSVCVCLRNLPAIAALQALAGGSADGKGLVRVFDISISFQ